MEENVEHVRENLRDTLNLRRRAHRHEDSDVRRCIGDQNNSKSVYETINKLKTKSAISSPELRSLKNAVIDDVKVIKLVLSTNGALRGLVRELSGNDVTKQCAAAGCFCNLALGDGKACSAIAKAAGPYLLPLLDNLSTELAVTSAWTIGNLAGSGPRLCQVLTAQGIVSKLIDLLSTTNAELQEAVLYALIHVTYQMKDDLMPEYLEKIIAQLSSMQLSLQSSNLLFIMSCHHNFTVSEVLLNNIQKKLSQTIKIHVDSCMNNTHCCSMYLIRILGNVEINVKNFDLFVNLITNDCDYIKLILIKEKDCAKDCLLWFLGNLVVFRGDDGFLDDLFS